MAGPGRFGSPQDAERVDGELAILLAPGTDGSSILRSEAIGSIR